jgi:hypothetical protein
MMPFLPNCKNNPGTQKRRSFRDESSDVTVTCGELTQGLLVAGAVVVGLVATAIVHQHNHFTVVHDALVAVHAGVYGGATTFVTSRNVSL